MSDWMEKLIIGAMLVMCALLLFWVLIAFGIATIKGDISWIETRHCHCTQPAEKP